MADGMQVEAPAANRRSVCDHSSAISWLGSHFQHSEEGNYMPLSKHVSGHKQPDTLVSGWEHSRKVGAPVLGMFFS